MSEQIKFDYRKWRGEKTYMGSVHRKYDFPVEVRRVGEPAPQEDR
ncbi:hypothetical protein AB0L74_10415 [Streptomyces sp. NPDC052020]